MCRICFTADITDHAPAATASLTNFVDGDSKTVARWHSTAHDRRAVRAHDYAVVRPAGRSEVEGSGAYVRLELGRTAEVRKTERLRVDGATPNENGQATSCPAVSVESRVNVDHQALPQ